MTDEEEIKDYYIFLYISFSAIVSPLMLHFVFLLSSHDASENVKLDPVDLSICASVCVSL